MNTVSGFLALYFGLERFAIMLIVMGALIVINKKVIEPNIRFAKTTIGRALKWILGVVIVFYSLHYYVNTRAYDIIIPKDSMWDLLSFCGGVCLLFLFFSIMDWFEKRNP